MKLWLDHWSTSDPARTPLKRKGGCMASTTMQQQSPLRTKKRASGLARSESLFAWIWVAPALFFVAVFLIYPTLSTVGASFLSADSSEFVGFENYQKIFTD